MALYTLTAGEHNLELPSDIYLVNTNKLYVECRTSTGQITINLPQINLLSAYGFHIYINDQDDNASTNNIIIKCAGGNKIAGQYQVSINENGVSAKIIVTGFNRWGFIKDSTNYDNSEIDEKIKVIQAELKIPSSLNFFKEFIYQDGDLARINIWTDEDKTNKIYQVDYVYSDGNLAMIDVERIEDEFTYAKIFDYDEDQNVKSINVLTT